MFLRRGVASLQHELFGGRLRPLRLLFPHASGDAAGFLDDPGRLGPGRGHRFLTLGLDGGERGVDLLGVGQTLRDLLSPLFEHPQYGLVCEPVEKRADDREADHLGGQMRPVHAEGSGDLFHLPAGARLDHQRERIHGRVLVQYGRLASVAPRPAAST